MMADEQVWKIRVGPRDSVNDRLIEPTYVEIHEGPTIQNVRMARHQARFQVAELLDVPLTTLRTEVVHED